MIGVYFGPDIKDLNLVRIIVNPFNILQGALKNCTFRLLGTRFINAVS
jgi:hypothetical protein